MKKEELKHYLNLYNLLKDAIKKGEKETNIKLYGRKKNVKIPEWLYKLEDIFEKIIYFEDDKLVAKVINRVYRHGDKDKRVMTSLPITESGYYRLKRKIKEKIYELYILSGDVTADEIYNNKIFY